jgi:N-acetylglucosamine malate deacetylase 2
MQHPTDQNTATQSRKPHAEVHARDPDGLHRGADTSTRSELPTQKSTIVLSKDLRHAARLAALESELQRLTGQSKKSRRDRFAEIRSTGSFAVLKRANAARFRLPRAFKDDLFNRFCGASEGVDSLRVLIVAAHQDDETIGAGARLFHLNDVSIAHVTDGAPRNEREAWRHGFSTREEYEEARWNELYNALELAGVPRERVIRLGFVDGEASGHLVDVCLRVTEVIDTIQPDVVLTHPYEGGHTDHDATAFAVHLACGILRREGVKPPAVFELTSYHCRNGHKVVQDFLPHERADLDQRVIQLNDEDQYRKQRMLDCFDTQRHIISDLSATFERFRPAPRYIFTEPPHPGILNYERFGDQYKGERWRQEAETALKTLRVRNQ